MARKVIDDAMWSKLEILITKVKRAVRPAKDDRLFIEALCWIIRTGADFASFIW